MAQQKRKMRSMCGTSGPLLQPNCLTKMQCLFTYGYDLIKRQLGLTAQRYTRSPKNHQNPAQVQILRLK